MGSKIKNCPKDSPWNFTENLLVQSKFLKKNFQHPIKPEADRKWRNAVVQLVINTMENLLMYFFEYCESDCNGFYVLVTRVTNMDATLNRKIMDATVKSRHSMWPWKAEVRPPGNFCGMTLALSSWRKIKFFPWHIIPKIAVFLIVISVTFMTNYIYTSICSNNHFIFHSSNPNDPTSSFDHGLDSNRLLTDESLGDS